MSPRSSRCNRLTTSASSGSRRGRSITTRSLDRRPASSTEANTAADGVLVVGWSRRQVITGTDAGLGRTLRSAAPSTRPRASPRSSQCAPSTSSPPSSTSRPAPIGSRSISSGRRPPRAAAIARAAAKVLAPAPPQPPTTATTGARTAASPSRQPVGEPRLGLGELRHVVGAELDGHPPRGCVVGVAAHDHDTRTTASRGATASCRSRPAALTITSRGCDQCTARASTSTSTSSTAAASASRRTATRQLGVGAREHRPPSRTCRASTWSGPVAPRPVERSIGLDTAKSDTVPPTTWCRRVDGPDHATPPQSTLLSNDVDESRMVDVGESGGEYVSPGRARLNITPAGDARRHGAPPGTA